MRCRVELTRDCSSVNVAHVAGVNSVCIAVVAVDLRYSYIFLVSYYSALSHMNTIGSIFAEELSLYSFYKIYTY